jgi:hypothetical protein
MQQTPEKPVAKEVLQLLDHTPPTSKTSCRTGCPCPAPRTFAWDDHNHTANTSKRKTRHSAASITSSFEVGALQQALVHQRGQLKDAKNIIRQQGKELREKDTDFEALKERLTGVDHPGALLAALIPADELEDLMDKMDGKDPAMIGARAKVINAGTTTAKRQVRVFSLLLEKVTTLLTDHTPSDSSDLWKLLFQNSHWKKVLRECVSADAAAGGKVKVLAPLIQGLKQHQRRNTATSTVWRRRWVLSRLWGCG